jgi:hypothetical protein
MKKERKRGGGEGQKMRCLRQLVDPPGFSGEAGEAGEVESDRRFLRRPAVFLWGRKRR